MAETDRTETPATDEPRPEWAIVEIMGHRRHAGAISEVQRFGASMLRIDVPGHEPGSIYATHYFGGPAIFSIRPCTEARARQEARYEIGAAPPALADYRPQTVEADFAEIDDGDDDSGEGADDPDAEFGAEGNAP